MQALYHREKTGKGSAIEVSLFDGMADWMNVPYLQTVYGSRSVKRVGLSHPSIAPYGAYINNKEQSKYELENIRKKNKRLLADRQRIEELSGNLSDIDGQNESLKLQHDANQLLYLGMSILLVGVAGITYKVMSSKSN